MPWLARDFFCFALVLLCFTVLPAFCHAARIALLTRSDIAPYSAFIDSYKEAYKKSGSDRHTLRVFFLDSEKQDQTTGTVSDFTAYGPNIVVCTGIGAVQFAREHFPQIPLVYSMVMNPREIADTMKPGLLGIGMDTDPGLKFEVLCAIKPDVKKIGAVYNPAESGEPIREAAAAAAKAGLDFQTMPVATPRESVAAIEKLMAGVDAFMLFFDRTVLTPQTIEAIFICSFRGKVPVIGFSEKYAALGALFSIEAQIRDLARETWKYTEVCLTDTESCCGIKKSAAAGKLVINKKIADKMNLKIPENIRAKGSLIE